jgi:hypothetical protein
LLRAPDSDDDAIDEPEDDEPPMEIEHTFAFDVKIGKSLRMFLADLTTKAVKWLPKDVDDWEIALVDGQEFVISLSSARSFLARAWKQHSPANSTKSFTEFVWC